MGRGGYDSRDADLKSDRFEGYLYGGGRLPGEVELGLYGGLGRSSHDQTRRISDFAYDTDYDSRHYRLGAELGRRWALTDQVSLRPFVSYQYLRLKVDGFDEGLGPYAVKTGDFSQTVQEIKAGTGLSWAIQPGASLEGRVYYSGLPSGSRAETSLVFNQNPLNIFRTGGNEFDRDAFGLNLAGSLAVAERAALKLDYQLDKSSHTTGHQGSLTLNLTW